MAFKEMIDSTLNVRVTERHREWVEQFAEEKGVTVSKAVRMILDGFFERSIVITAGGANE